MLASEYGWGLRDILDRTYPEEFFALQRQITMRHIDKYLMQTAIVTNPHKSADDAKEFVESLLQQRQRYHGSTDAPVKLDVAAFDKLKRDMQRGSRMIKAG